MNTNGYSTKSNANRAAKKEVANTNNEFALFQMENGRWNYMVDLGTKKTNRGGGRKFMTGVHVRRTEYREGSVSRTVFDLCRALAEVTGRKVAFRAHVVAAAQSLGIKTATARAAYTHYKQVYALDVKVGRPTEADNEKFAEFMAVS